MYILQHLIIILAALSGFLVAYHIRHKKMEGPFVCPMHFDCHTVVTSKYSKLFGIPIEYIGMVYYLLIASSYALFIIYPELRVTFYTRGVLIITVVAFLYSMYLTGVQAFKLREWCTYCLFSAGMCTIIFAFVFLISRFML